MAALGVLQTVDDGLFKGGERGVVAPMETLGFHKLPEPFNEIEIRGIGGQPKQGNPEAFRLGHDEVIALVAGIIQDDGNRKIGEAGSYLGETTRPRSDY